ncbi:hypothetical protein CRENBAI_011427 [Crenichthys baileyi]|uniref:Uncharacterized protein n=1 Tax=Crenichthys baileyi TaxID=28760 RepID=A0AAV9SKP7_9TELE
MRSSDVEKGKTLWVVGYEIKSIIPSSFFFFLSASLCVCFIALPSMLLTRTGPDLLRSNPLKEKDGAVSSVLFLFLFLLFGSLDSKMKQSEADSLPGGTGVCE